MTADWSSDGHLMISADSGVTSCVTGSTAVDALRLALGSTLGAFIALAVVVAFVLVAKCQHRRRDRRMRRRRRRRYSDKSLPLTDSDNLSFFDYYDDNDDDYGSVYTDPHGGPTADLTTAAITEFTSRSSPLRFPQCEKSRLVSAEEFVVTDDQKWKLGDTSSKLYDFSLGVESFADADRQQVNTDSTQCSRIAIGGTHSQSALDSSMACRALFVSGVTDGDAEKHSSQDFQVTTTSTSAPRCASSDVVDETVKTTVGPRSETLRPITDTQLPVTAAGIIDTMTTDCCDTAGLLSIPMFDVQRTTNGLKPNRYSSLW